MKPYEEFVVPFELRESQNRGICPTLHDVIEAGPLDDSNIARLYFMFVLEELKRGGDVQRVNYLNKTHREFFSRIANEHAASRPNLRILSNLATRVVDELDKSEDGSAIRRLREFEREVFEAKKRWEQSTRTDARAISFQTTK